MGKSSKAAAEGRLRRWSRRLLKLLVGLLALVVVVLLVVSVMLDRQATKRWAADKINGALDGVFTGKLIIDKIGTLGWAG